MKSVPRTRIYTARVRANGVVAQGLPPAKGLRCVEPVVAAVVKVAGRILGDNRPMVVDMAQGCWLWVGKLQLLNPTHLTHLTEDYSTPVANR